MEKPLEMCLHSLEYGTTAICPTHGVHDHHERDEYRNAVLDEIERLIRHDGASASVDRIQRLIKHLRGPT